MKRLHKFHFTVRRGIDFFKNDEIDAAFASENLIDACLKFDEAFGGDLRAVTYLGTISVEEGSPLPSSTEDSTSAVATEEK